MLAENPVGSQPRLEKGALQNNLDMLIKMISMHEYQDFQLQDRFRLVFRDSTAVLLAKPRATVS